MTTIYLIRHSQPLQVQKLNYNDSLQLRNEKAILSVIGEARAKSLSELEEFDKVDYVISSNYVRTMATAKYIADRNNIDVLVEEDFRERKQGVNSYDYLPNDFEIKQFYDEDYKIGDGESQKEVRERYYKSLLKILEQYKDNKIVILSHATAMMFLLKKWCEIDFNGTEYKMLFNDQLVFEDSFNAPEVFKLIFNDKELVSIENIRLNMIEKK